MNNVFIYNQQHKRKDITWFLFFFVFGTGAYLYKEGKVLKWFFYMITLQGLGLWAIYKLFTLNRDIDRFNNELADRLGLSDEERTIVGLRKGHVTTSQSVEVPELLVEEPIEEPILEEDVVIPSEPRAPQNNNHSFIITLVIIGSILVLSMFIAWLTFYYGGF